MFLTMLHSCNGACKFYIALAIYFNACQNFDNAFLLK